MKITNSIAFIFAVLLFISCSKSNNQEKTENAESQKAETKAAKKEKLPDSSIIYEQEDKKIFSSFVKKAQDNNWSELPVRKVIVKAGRFFLGKPYVAHTLEISEREKLIVNMRGLDCTTLVETSFALARTIKSGNTSFDNFCRQLEKIRYRNGELKKYPSRLHYTSDWIYENEQQGLIKRLNKQLGGVPFDKQINFMTENTDSYDQLDNDAFVEKIRSIEESINSRKYYYIPENQIKTIESKVKSGYLLGFTSTVEGLDIAHVALALRKGNNLHFIHASSAADKVVISEETVTKYLKSSDRVNGLIVSKALSISNN